MTIELPISHLCRILLLLQTDIVVERAFPFQQAYEAYCHVEQIRHFGKIVIEVAQKISSDVRTDNRNDEPMASPSGLFTPACVSNRSSG
ncbi:hypothetical protein [Collimonas humicola]|uniref:hypothetical protein n=1 Tax=Collimonas humicola TaxID=2825886 RepID=UPI001B8A9B43|nr:hypothetical protein [Collimonas humicola]